MIPRGGASRPEAAGRILLLAFLGALPGLALSLLGATRGLGAALVGGLVTAAAVGTVYELRVRRRFLEANPGRRPLR